MTNYHLKENLAKHCFTGKKSCTYFIIRHRDGIMLSVDYEKGGKVL